MRFPSLLLLVTTSASAAPVDFVREVRPIFEKHCYECHGEKKQKSGLRLDIKSEALKGGDKHAPDIQAGDAAKSSLIHFITTTDEDEIMPPKGKLASEDIETLTRWINEGAHWPDGVDLAKLEDRRDHWAFKPLAKSSLHSIDAFIDAKLTEKGLHRSPPADPVTWLRRVTFDLTGLPPTPEEVAAFSKSKDHAAVVERLLVSPRYGEHWAQHWLDVVRYADTHGFEVNTERPNAWPYRDYVIRAFNNDTPYDRFIKEQIVGDAMGEDAATGFLVTASVLLPGQIGKDEPSKRLARQDSIDEIVVNIGQTFLGLSIGCARCHDHKFDPISAKDYYSMQAFVAGVEYGDRELRTPEALAAREELKKVKAQLTDIEKQLSRFVPIAKSGVKRPMIDARENRDRFMPVKARRVRFTIRDTNKLEPCIDELEVFTTTGENIALNAPITVSGEKVSADRHEQRFVNDGNYGNSRSWMSNEVGKGWVMVEFPQEQEIDRVVWGRDRQGKFKDRLATSYVIETADDSGAWRVVADSDDRQRYDERDRTQPAFSTQGLRQDEIAEAQRLIDQKRPLDEQLQRISAEQKVFAGTFRTPDDIHLLNRGDPEQPKESVVPAVLSALGTVTLTNETAEQERRRVLADWIASPRNPLTARVMVNRIWQGHFGTGLVETPSDFGRMGVKPTHPELLDWLAAEFIKSGWSVKHMHRLIVMSETYRQSSKTMRPSDNQTGRQSDSLSLSPSLIVYKSPSANTIDSDARLLWRFPSRRLEAESIRDSMLAVSGLLDLKMYGRGYNLFDKRGGLSGFEPVDSLTPDNKRRMIYAHKVRREPEAVFGAFDCPDAGQSTAIRRASTTPIQALNLFNSRFTLDTASAFATRLQKEAGDDIAAQITSAYKLALNRSPTTAELHDTGPTVREYGLSALCRALFNSNEFLFMP
ncbi:PSD1 and planctomycete cytochrome C domain-containing protein [Prosthecobacter sp.]|uniref:PSD1 and planctomycete cytochrome C domain-containing protein n=1 Tax=Prosthecobacter sp. TaxID=1965333 RepID=UPI001E069581|nr:PSD1 and planctomycete cytochrome C domain-containing protein [Prosthecobacter sp.]MCB1276691.1 PSD1 domain-containing protein [Prosthecobacter sp.]